MLDHLAPLIARYRSKGILIDANLMLLLFIGSYNPAKIATFKRIQDRSGKGYTEKDFELLVGFLEPFKTIVTTPHILTEISNFTDMLMKRDQVYAHVFKELVSRFLEIHLPSEVLCALPYFYRFGLTDTAIAELAPDTYLVLSNDFELTGRLSKQGADAINFNHIRPLNWQ